jgi:hypothetical protein
MVSKQKRWPLGKPPSLAYLLRSADRVTLDSYRCER